MSRGFLRFVFVADYGTSKNAGAKSCKMNTCTKMVGGDMLRSGFSAGPCSRSEPVGPALCPVSVNPVDSYSCTRQRSNSHGMILLQKNIGGRG
jgi:hypothetical protein